MLVAFSTQDQQKLQIVAGSMRDAFGVQTDVRYSGIIEIDGLPTRPKLKNAAQHPAGGCLGQRRRPDEQEPQPAISAPGSRTTAPSRSPRPRCGRRCRTCRSSPKLSKHIMIEETKQGLNIEIVDQDGRSMFPEGSKEPYERTRRLVQRLAAPLKATALPHLDRRPHRGEQAAGAAGLWAVGTVGRPRQRGAPDPRGGGRADRPHFFMVAGKADTQPLFPDDPFVAANRRVTITLMREEPPMPLESEAVDSAAASLSGSVANAVAAHVASRRGGAIRPPR